MRFLAWFNEIPDEELMATAGGKGASLCRMSRQKLPVPEGFIVSSSMFNYFMESSICPETRLCLTKLNGTAMLV